MGSFPTPFDVQNEVEFTVCYKWSGGSPGGPPSAPRAAAQVRGAILGAILGAQKCPKSDQRGSRNHRTFVSSFLIVFGPRSGYNFGQMLVQNGAPERIRGAGFKFGPFLKIYGKNSCKINIFHVGRSHRLDKKRTQTIPEGHPKPIPRFHRFFV